nr:MAG TPA: protein of unknown function (DUF2213) [Caudoviricetes sp.]
MEPVLRRVRRRDCIRLDVNDRTFFTEEGYLVDHPVVTSCGIFEYINPDGSIRRELRLPENVFSETSLKTYKGKPIIITHDAGVVNKENVDREQVGTILSEGYRDKEDVRAEIIIHNTDAMKQRGFKELSLGYNLDLIEQPGTWNGEPYDAIQTNIVINHLALVASARAGEQARLNIDSSDEQELKGGKLKMSEDKNKSVRTDGSAELTPEELEQAIALYVASKKNDNPDTVSEGVPVADSEDEPVNEGTEAVKEDESPSQEELVADIKSKCENISLEPDNAENTKTVLISLKDDLDKLLSALGEELSESVVLDEDDKETGEGELEKVDSEDSCKSSSEAKVEPTINADSVDSIISEKLSICRIGDKLRMDGLEKLSIKQAKLAIIKKVFPTMRMDGKSNEYINAIYDMAVSQSNKPKGIEYQKQQMTSGRTAARQDSSTNVSMAASARDRMINRTEGGK